MQGSWLSQSHLTPHDALEHARGRCLQSMFVTLSSSCTSNTPCFHASHHHTLCVRTSSALCVFDCPLAACNISAQLHCVALPACSDFWRSTDRMELPGSATLVITTAPSNCLTVQPRAADRADVTQITSAERGAAAVPCAAAAIQRRQELGVGPCPASQEGPVCWLAGAAVMAWRTC